MASAVVDSSPVSVSAEIGLFADPSTLCLPSKHVNSIITKQVIIFLHYPC